MTEARTPTISVIVPVFNVEKYVEESLRSVLDQSFKDFELIVVDDASPDGSHDICQKLAKSDARIKIIRHEFNRGSSEARNTGLIYAQGKYVYFFDSDDLLLENALEVFHRTAEENNADVVHCTERLHRFEQSDGSFKNDQLKRRDLKPYEGLLSTDRNARLMGNYVDNGMSVVIWVNFYRRDFLERNRLKFLPIVAEDEPFFVAVQCLAERFYCIRDFLYVYTRRIDSLSNKKSSSRAAKGIDAMIAGCRYLEAIFSTLPEDVLSGESRSQCLQTFIRRMLSSYITRQFDAKALLEAKTMNRFIAALRPSFIENADVAARLIQNCALQCASESSLREQSSAEQSYIKNLNRDEIRMGFFVGSQRKKLWNVMIKLLLEVDRICRKHDIRYFAHAGTLLGAVRHKGFIPWDDDVDLMMLRPDYEKFKRVAAKELGSNYFLDLWYNYAWEGETNEEQLPVVERRGTWPIGCSFIKIRDNRTMLLSSKKVRSNINNGIFIDIFPFDPIPPFSDREHNISFAIERELLGATFFPERIADALENNSEFLTNTDELKQLIQLPYKQRALQYEKYLSEHFFESDNVYWFHSFVLRGKTIPSSAYRETIELPFEQIKVPAPRGFDSVLSGMYGDWHELRVNMRHDFDVYSSDISYREYFAAIE